MRAFAAIKSDPFGNDAFGDEAIRPSLVLTAVAYQYRLHDLRRQQRQAQNPNHVGPIALIRLRESPGHNMPNQIRAKQKVLASEAATEFKLTAQSAQYGVL